MRHRLALWAPAVLMAAGCVLTLGFRPQNGLPLRRALAEAVPRSLREFRARDVAQSRGEGPVGAFTDYVMRVYERPITDDPEATADLWFAVYVGYYDSQSGDRTIHSSRNALPGAGWDVLGSTTAVVDRRGQTVTVNRHVVQRDDARALVLYWYQGRGRVEQDEYVVKLDLVRDAAFRGRSEEALVRVVVPIVQSEQRSFELARILAADLVPMVFAALPQ